MNEIPKRDLVILLGDFNARVGEYQDAWKGVIGKCGLKDEAQTENGLRLLEFSAANDLCVCSTFFQHKEHHKYTHYSRNAQGTRSQIDHILIKRRWKTSVQDTRVFRGADFANTDHRLLMSKVMIKLI